MHYGVCPNYLYSMIVYIYIDIFEIKMIYKHTIIIICIHVKMILLAILHFTFKKSYSRIN